MEFLREVLKGVRRLVEPEDQPTGDDELDLSSEEPTDSEPSDDFEYDTTLGEPEDDELPAGEMGPPDEGAPFTPPAGGSGGGVVGTPSDGPSDEEYDLGEPEANDQAEGEDEHPELDGLAGDATEDPDRQGLIRTVKDAHLVYKRNTEDGTFEELWVYNVSTLRDELNVKKAILAGTDIPPNKTASPDGSQTYEIWSAGNAEMILIRGLPN
jgi:hypothetical protein